jgi:hypothetical protein
MYTLANKKISKKKLRRMYILANKKLAKTKRTIKSLYTYIYY